MTIIDTRPQLIITEQARRAVAELCEQVGRVALLLDWPGGVGFEPNDEFSPEPDEAILTHIHGCPVYVDLRQLRMAAARHVRLDVNQRTHTLALTAMPNSATRVQVA